MKRFLISTLMIFTAFNVYSVQAETVSYTCLVQDIGVEVTSGNFDLTSQPHPNQSNWMSGQAEFQIPYTRYTVRLEVSGARSHKTSFDLYQTDLTVWDPNDSARFVRSRIFGASTLPFGQSRSIWLYSSLDTAHCSFTIQQ